MKSFAAWAGVCLTVVLGSAAESALGAPTISISSPAKNASFAAPATIPITASVKASSGTTISKVDFYQGTTLLGTVTKSPYTFTWSGVPTGSYSLTAKATDSKAATKTSAAVAVTVAVATPPTVSITAPTNNAAYTAPATIAITATAKAATGATLSKVDFYQGTTLLGTVTKSPYTYAWSAVAAGGYSLTAKATDSKGATATSAAVAVTVAAPAPPTVSITTPANNASFSAPASIPITASITAASGLSISKVDFYSGATLLGTVTAAPYAFTWSAVPAGSYVISAKATDSLGSATTSASVAISVKVPSPPPTISIIAPTTGAAYSVPATIPIAVRAAATGPGASIARVDFYDGSKLIGSSTAMPFSFTWSNVATGGHYLSATATDTLGASASSSGIYVAVDGTDSCLSTPPLTAADKATKLAALDHLPMSFEVNVGQSAREVRYQARGAGYQLFLTANAATLALSNSSRARSRTEAKPDEAAIQMRFLGANPNARISGIDQVQETSNYLVGRDPAAWHRNVPHFAKVRYESLYPGIDQVFYGNEGRLEYDFVVAAGANPRNIRLALGGTDRVSVNRAGDLLLKTRAGTLTQRQPVAYQEIDGIRHPVKARYAMLAANEVGFRVGDYDRHYPLVIDPVLVYSTYLGGASANSAAFAVAVSRCGEAYVAGFTRAMDFPTTPGVLQKSVATTWYMGFVAKLNQSGTGLLYSTYISGTDGSTQVKAIALDGVGNAYVAGSTVTTDFPTTPGVANPTNPTRLTVGFVSKLSTDGSSLLASSYIGAATGLALDGSNNIYALINGLEIWKYDPALSTLIYATPNYTGNQGQGAMAVDATGNAYLAITATGPNLPVSTGAFQPSFPGSTNLGYSASGYVVKFDPTGTPIFSTYLGTSGLLSVSGLAIDSAGSVYVAGTSDDSGTVPNAVAGTVHTFTNNVDMPGNYWGYVAKLSGDGTALGYFARFGGSSCSTQFCSRASTTANAIAVDAHGQAVVTGDTISNELPLANPMQSQFSTAAYANDGYVLKLNPSGSSLVLSTLLGGHTTAPGGQYVSGTNGSSLAAIALDSIGSIYVAGYSATTDFPTTPGAIQPAIGAAAGASAVVAKFNETKDTRTTLSVAPNPSIVRLSTTLTASIAGNAPGGTVTFLDGSTTLGGAAVNGETAQLNFVPAAGGPHTLTASYSGDAHNHPSVSAPVTVKVGDPYTPPTAMVTGIVDGSSFFANSGNTYTGATATVSGTAAPGNIVTYAYLNLGTSTSYYWPNGLQTFSGSLALPAQPVGDHTIWATIIDNYGNKTLSTPMRFAVNAATATPPAVVITSPANGATFSAPAQIVATAAATPASGKTISWVSYVLGRTSTNSVSASPYALTLTDVSAGTYSLLALAADNAGGMTYSAPVTVTVTAPAIPSVTLTSPSMGAAYVAPGTIGLSASASAAPGATISKVSFYNGSVLLGTAMASPYSFTWTNVAAGNYVLTAVATDSKAVTGTSAPVGVTVAGTAGGTTSGPPVAAITSPANYSAFAEPASVTVSAIAYGIGSAAIASVAFYDATNNLLGSTSLPPPYALEFSGLAAGTYTVIAKTIDTTGAVAISDPVSFVVTRSLPLAVAITTTIPADSGSMLTAPADHVTVLGTVTAPPNSAVSVNGVLGTVIDDGTYFVNDVPLKIGGGSTDVLTVTLTTPDGQTAANSLVASSYTVAPFRFTAAPTSGLLPLTTWFGLSDPGGLPFSHADVSCTDDGTVQVTTTTLASDGLGGCQYTAPGTYRARLNVYAQPPGQLEQVIYTDVRMVHVESLTERDNTLRGVFVGMMNRLKAGNISGALNAVTASGNAKLSKIFSGIGAVNLATVVDQLGVVRTATVTEKYGEYTFVRNTAGGPIGYPIFLIRGEDGIWRIDGM
jgi:hypothetical protein